MAPCVWGGECRLGGRELSPFHSSAPKWKKNNATLDMTLIHEGVNGQACMHHVCAEGEG